MKEFFQKSIEAIKNVSKKNKDTKEIDFTGKLVMDDNGKGKMKSYGQETPIERKGENLFVLGDIEGAEKEIMEVADFINKAKNIALKGIFRDSDMYVDKIIFDYDKKYGDSVPYVGFSIEYTKEAVEGMGNEYEAGFGSGSDIIEKRIWDKLTDKNPIKKNIMKIINYLNARGKENNLQNLGTSYKEKDILSDFA